MKIDTSTYYPEALLPEDPDEERKESKMQAVNPEDSDREEEEKNRNRRLPKSGEIMNLPVRRGKELPMGWPHSCRGRLCRS